MRLSAMAHHITVIPGDGIRIMEGDPESAIVADKLIDDGLARMLIPELARNLTTQNYQTNLICQVHGGP